MRSGFKNILFPTDFSDSAVLAVPLARDMAAALGARVTCLHVTDDPIEEWICSWSLAPDTPGQSAHKGRPGYRTAALEKLRAFADAHFADLTPAPNLEVTEGKTVEAIVRYAEEHMFDLVVMGGRSYSDPDLHETTTDRIIRMSSIPVLTVCEPVADFVRL